MLLIFDLIGAALFVVAYFYQSFLLPFWSFFVFVGISIVLFAIANIQIFKEQEEEVEELRYRITELQDGFVNNDSLVITPDPLEEPCHATITYVRGSETIKEVSIVVEYIDRDGQYQDEIVEQELILQQGQNITIDLLFLDAAKEGFAVVKVYGVGARSEKKIQNSRVIEFDPDRIGRLLFSL